MQNGPKMKWTFMSLQILDDVRQGKMTFAEMFPRARAAGFVAYDASDMDAEFASREEVLALCRDAGLRIADYIHWVHMTDPDEAGVQAAIESGKQAVHTALAHGTHKLMIVENVVPEDLARMTREEAAEKMTRALRSIVEYAADYGVTVMVEDFPSPLLPMATSAQMRKLLDGAPGLRLILDGVFNHCGYYWPPFQDLVRNGENSKYRDWFFPQGYPVTLDPCNYDCVGHYFHIL